MQYDEFWVKYANCSIFWVVGSITNPIVNSASKCFVQKVHSLNYFKKFQHFAEGVDARKNSNSRFLEWGWRTQQLIHSLLWTVLVTSFECFSKNVKYWILVTQTCNKNEPANKKNSAFCLRKLTWFVAKWHLWSIFVQNFNLLVSKTKLHWLAQQLERNSLLTRIFEPISLWQQKSFVLTRDVDSAHIVLRGSSPGLLTFSHIFGSERRLRRTFWEGDFFLQYFHQVCNIVKIHDISKNTQLKWWKTCIIIYGGNLEIKKSWWKN